MTEVKITEDEWKVVEERLNQMSGELKLGILGRTFTKEELINEVHTRTPVGIAYAEMQIETIKWLAKQILG